MSGLGGGDWGKFWANMVTGAVSTMTESTAGAAAPAAGVKAPKEMIATGDGTMVATAKFAWPVFLIGGLGVLALGGVILLKMKKKTS